MNKYVKMHLLIYVLTFNPIFFLKAGEDFGLYEKPEKTQQKKPDKLVEMNKRHLAERKNLDKEYDQKEQNLEKERAEKKRIVTTTNDRVNLSGPEGKKGATTSQASKVDDYYNDQSTKLKNERKQKMKDLRSKQNAQHDAEVEKMLAANDALDNAFKADTTESQTDERTDLGKGIDANKNHLKILADLKEAYENKISKLESQYKNSWGRLNQKKEFAEKTTRITIDNKIMTGDEAQQYYVDKLFDLKDKLDADKKQALDDYTKQKEAQEQKFEDEVHNIFHPKPKEKQVSEAVMTKELSQVTPRQIEKFVNQFSKDVIPDLTEKQKKSLRDVVSSLQEQVGMGESIHDILQNDRENISEKLQLSDKQKETFENNYTSINSSNLKKTGFFEALLELFSKILGK